MRLALSKYLLKVQRSRISAELSCLVQIGSRVTWRSQ